MPLLRPFLALSVLTLAVLSGGCDRTPDTIRIGVAQPLSGGLKEQGQDLLNGAQMAVDEINAKGGVRIDSKQVQLEVVAQDDKAEPQAGVAAAEALVKAEVMVAIADLNSGVSIAAAPVYAKAGVPQFAISTNTRYTQLNLPTTLRLVANDGLQARALAKYASQLKGAERFAVIDDSTAYGKGLADDVNTALAALGKKIVLRKALDNKGVEFAALVAELGKSDADVLVPMLSDFQVEVLVKQLADAGLGRIRILGADGLKTDRLLKSGGKLQSIHVTSPIIEAREFSEGPAFLDRFRARFKGDPVYAAHYAYDTVHLVADALSRNGSTDRAKLLKRLKSFDGKAPVTGSLLFRPDGEQRYGAIAVYELRDAKWSLVMRSDQW